MSPGQLNGFHQWVAGRLDALSGFLAMKRLYVQYQTLRILLRSWAWLEGALRMILSREVFGVTLTTHRQLPGIALSFGDGLPFN
jgi:hypothetical protein